MPRSTRFGRTDGTGNPSRRRVLQMTGSGLTAGAGIAVGTRTTVAEDCTDETCPLDKHSEDYAELIYDELNSAVEKVKNGLQEGNDDDHCEYHMNDDKLLVIQPVECNFGFNGAGCGRTDFNYRVYQSNSNYEYRTRWTVYLSDDDTGQAASYLRNNYKIFSIISTVLPRDKAIAVALFAQVNKYTANELESTNEGCGVRIRFDCPIITSGNPLDYSWENESELQFGLHPQ